MSTALQLLQEATYKYGFTAVNLPAAQADYVIKWGRQMIADEDLYYDEEGGCGRETEPHITVLYGLTDKEPSKELLKLIRETPPFTARLTGVTLFENEKNDVVKFDVDSEELVALSNAIRAACPNENKYPEYVPHCTVAYVKKGRAVDLAGSYPFEADPPISAEFEINEIIFKPAGDSEDPKRKTTIIPLNRFVKEAESPKAALGLKKITRPLRFKWVPDNFYFRTPTYELVKKIPVDAETRANAVTTDLDAVRQMIIPDDYWCFPPKWTVNDITSGQRLESLLEAEDPKTVFRLAKAALGRWVMTRLKNAYGEALRDPHYLKAYGDPGNRSGLWTTNFKEATQYRSEQEAWQELRAIFGNDMEYWEGGVDTQVLNPRDAKLEAEDPKTAFQKFPRRAAWSLWDRGVTDTGQYWKYGQQKTGQPMFVFYLTQLAGDEYSLAVYRSDQNAYVNGATIRADNPETAIALAQSSADRIVAHAAPKQEAEDPKAVLKSAGSDAFVIWTYDAGNHNFMRVEQRPSGKTYWWTGEPHLASRFKDRDEAWTAAHLFYPHKDFEQFRINITPMSQALTFVGEAEDPKSILYQARPYDQITIKWVDQHGQEHSTSYYDLPLYKAEEELKKNLVINRSPYTVAKVLEVTPKALTGVGESRSPFDLLSFPSDPSVLASKLLELDTVEKPTVL